MKAVIYARVSMEELDPESQLTLLREFAKKHGIEVVGELVEYASAYVTRPEDRETWLKAVLTAKETGSVILVISLDRVSRRYEDLVRTLDILREYGVQVIAVQEPWLQALATIPDQTLRKFIYDILVRAMAYSYQKYVESIIEKTKAGLMRARAEGKRVGRPPKISDHVIEKYLRRYRRAGVSLRAIWRLIMEREGVKITYPGFLKRVKKLGEKRKEGT